MTFYYTVCYVATAVDIALLKILSFYRRGWGI